MSAARAGIAALLLAWAGAASAVERYAVIVGNDAGARDDVPLRYAESDAARVYDVLKDLGGFHPENMVLLAHESAATVRRALIDVNARVRAAEAEAPGQTVLVVYYSGHADGHALHLGQSQLELGELEALVRGSSSAFRLLVLDSCHAGALTRRKGGRSAPPLPLRVEERLAGQGAVVLAASAADEDAQESDEIKGSFFTHALVSGLVGAADGNGDGQVTLDEAYHYAYEATLRASSRTFAGAQHPSFHYELRGQGDLVLTRVGADRQSRGLLELPAGRAYLVLQESANGAVVAEVGADDRARRVDLRAGRYFVRGHGADSLVEGTVTLSAGELRPVRDGELRRIEYARLVRKGGTPLRLVHGPQAGYRLRTGIGGASLCQGLFAGWNLELRHVSIAPRVAYCRSTLENATLRGDVDAFDGELGLAHAFDLPGFTLEFGVATGGALLHQAFVTSGRSPPRTSGAFQVSATAAVSTDLPRGFYLSALVAAETYFLSQVARDGSSHFGPAFTVAASFGAGRRW